VAPYPFTTQVPQPGMLPHENIQFQLLDLPPLSPDHPLPWLATTLQTADAALLVVDLTDADCVQQLETVHAMLAERRVTLGAAWPADGGGDRNADRGDGTDSDGATGGDVFTVRLPALLLANHADRVDDPAAELQALRELSGLRWPALVVSAATGRGLGDIGPWLFRQLAIVRVYTKVPGHPAERERPFALRRGQTVGDVARLVHRDLARTLRYARLWGPSGFDGQQVGPEHRVADGDVIELHT
jgi:ribosome-interacting GTPase 1